MSGFNPTAGRASALMTEGEGHLSKWTLFSSSQKYEDAAECFTKAGNMFKVGNMFMEAGDAYKKAADILGGDKVKSMHEASSALLDAGNCYKKVSPPDAINCYRQCITNWCEAGRFSQAAKIQKDIADMYEKDGNAAEAIENYNQAAIFFDTENSKSQGNQCQLKVAELCSAMLDPPDLARASEIYENQGRNSLDSPLVKYNAKNYFLACVFCHLAMGDTVAANIKLELFGGYDFTFRDSREGKLCESLITNCEAYDSDGFANSCMEFDRVNKLDGWRTEMLVRIKRNISGAAGDGGGEEEFDLT